MKEERKKPNAVLTAEGVVELRRLSLKGKLNVREAAMIYGVSPETIRRAVRGDTWLHLGGLNKTQDELAEEGRASLKRFMAMREGEKARLARNLEIVKGIDDVGIGREGKPGDAGYED